MVSKMDMWFHIVDCLIGVFIAVSLFMTNFYDRLVLGIAAILLYSLQTMVIQVLRRQGSVVVPFIFMFFPKKLKEKLITEM